MSGKKKNDLIERTMIDAESEIMEMDDEEAFKGLYGENWEEEVYGDLFTPEEIKKRKMSRDSGENINSAIRRTLNSICRKYNGWKKPEEIRKCWEELSKVGVDILITGAPKSNHAGSKSWVVSYEYYGKRVDNSKFVYDVYEDVNRYENEYNMYFS